MMQASFVVSNLVTEEQDQFAATHKSQLSKLSRLSNSQPQQANKSTPTTQKRRKTILQTPLSLTEETPKVQK